MFDRSLNRLVALDESQMTAQSLLLATPTFQANQFSASPGKRFEPSDFQLLDYDGPKLRPELPGISVSEMPDVNSGEAGAKSDDNQQQPATRRARKTLP